MAAITVEMGEMMVARAADPLLQGCGLGACVGLCLYENAARIAVLSHIVLPTASPAPPSAGRQALPPRPGKCADTAIRHALSEIVRLGGNPQYVQAAIVGGARIFTESGSESTALTRLEIGTRNVLAVKEELIQYAIPLSAEETGGHGGRTVTLSAATGEVRVRPVGLNDRWLATLGWRGASVNLVREEALAYGR